MRFALTIVCALALGPAAWARLPPLSDEAKAKATDAAAKSAWSDKVGLYQLCQSMDRTAAHYRRSAKDAPPPVETPPCADPGPFVAAAAPASAPPLESSGAHSPAEMATAPPSTNATAAEQQGHVKK